MSSLVEERRISTRAFLGHYIIAILAGLVIAAICFMTPFAVLAPVGILPFAAVYAWARLTRVGSSYRLFDDRLEIESGLISKKIENVELFRIRDVGLRQSVLGRIGNFGDVYVHSTDSSTPDLHVASIDAPKEFYQRVRELVSQSRAQHRTMIVEEGSFSPER